MSVLLLRLAAPLQSWGVASRHMTRGTLTHPTKSGVIGLLAAAQGRRRGEDLSDLAGMRFGVRVDQPGQLLIDYHTVSGASHAPLYPALQRLPTADGKTLKVAESTKVTRRQYLTDAVFIVGLQGHASLLQPMAHALLRPRFPLYLGRRSCPPTRPVLLGIHQGDLEEVLRTTAWQAAPHHQRLHNGEGAALDLIIEDPAGNDVITDQPLPSAAFDRRFATRPITHTVVDLHGSHNPFDAIPEVT
jgi:CRISPR system Cascade subunit CasD